MGVKAAAALQTVCHRACFFNSAQLLTKTGQVASASFVDQCVKSGQSLGFNIAPGSVGVVLTGGGVVAGGVTGGGVVVGGVTGGDVGTVTQPPSNKARSNRLERSVVMDLTGVQSE